MSLSIELGTKDPRFRRFVQRFEELLAETSTLRVAENIPIPPPFVDPGDPVDDRVDKVIDHLKRMDLFFAALRTSLIEAGQMEE